MNQITENQAIALRKFGVTEKEIQTMSKSQASNLLTQFIERIQSRKNGGNAPDKDREYSLYAEVGNYLIEATSLVMQKFGLTDKAKLSEAYLP